MAGAEPLSDAWILDLVAASAEAADDQVGDRSGVIAFAIGKSRRAVVSMVDGRIVGPIEAAEAEIDVSIPVTEEQLVDYLSGSESMAQAYIRGDIKPVGSTGPLLALIELVESGALGSVV